jgi:hypothetical protein
VRVRPSFLLALLAVSLGTAALILIPVGRHAYSSWQERRADHRASLAAEKRVAQLKPAMALMARMPVPSRYVDTCPNKSSIVPMLCWKAAASPVAATTVLEHAVRSVGGTDVSARCVNNEVLGPVCQVTARLAGSPFVSFLGPQIRHDRSGYHHYGVHIDATVFMPVPSLPIGTPIPLPPT